MSYVDLNTIHNPATGNIAPAAWGDQVRDNQEWFANSHAHDGSAGGGGVIGPIAVQTSAITVSNTTAETSLGIISIPANTLSTDHAVRFAAWGSHGSAGGMSSRWRVKYGGTTILDSTQLGINANSNQTWLLSGVLIGNAATNAQIAFGQLWYSNGATKMREQMTGTAAIDSTSAQNLQLTGQHTAANPSNTITRRYWTAYRSDQP